MPDNDTEKLKVDAVFEGGGVKGIGLVGAASAVEKAGYQFENLAGTSAGDIVSTLLAVGYSADAIKLKLEQLDYLKFKDKGILDHFGILGKLLSLGFEFGIYEGDYFENWFDTLLDEMGPKKFGEIRTEHEEEKYRYKAQMIATDLSDRRLLILPGDLKDFGYDPDEFSISRAVRMSMSIPFFFEPVKLEDGMGREHIIVDGGVLSNYPIWLLDDGSDDPPWPTFGFKLIEKDERKLKQSRENEIKDPIQFIKSIVGTMLDAHDSYHISNSSGDYQRTIGIPTVVKIDGEDKEIKTTVSAKKMSLSFLYT